MSFQRKLVLKMMKTNESLEFVIDKIINDSKQKIKASNRLNQTMNAPNPRKSSPSPYRSPRLGNRYY